jgi:predicted RNA-binding Zn-ribbon protein involved in translation (DUF1610 family)
MEEDFNPTFTEKVQFPCKSCGAFLTFKPSTSSLVCSSCGVLNEIEQATEAQRQEALQEIDYEKFINNLTAKTETIQIATVKCTSCGAESTLKPNVTSDNCPFCGTALVVSSGGLSSVIKPKAVLPFKIEQNAGFGLFKTWINSLWFAPNSLKKYANNPDKLTGMYIPYWTYDARTYTHYTGQRGEYYYVAESYRDAEGKTQSRQVQKTRWYSASGNVNNAFDDITVIASDSLPRDYTRGLEPWDLHDLQVFDERYLSGFRSESYHVDVKQGFEYAKSEMEPIIDNTIRQDIGGDTQVINSKNIKYNDITFKHILLPIWISAYRFNDKVYRFMINGRTGKVTGERPWSWIKITLAILLVLAIIGGILYWREKNRQTNPRRSRGAIEKVPVIAF